LPSFVDALKDLRELPGLDQAEQDLGHAVDAGVPDNESV
jgi:hypothetical protein